MENTKGYVKGIIGALIGGLIASLLWIIFYVYFNMLWSILALPIALGALKGYRILKGTENKKLPIIISVVSVIVITIVTLIIIPLLLLAKQGLDVSFSNLELLYSISEFKTGIIRDYLMSLLFTFLGISGTISNIKKQVNEKSNSTEEI